MALSYRCELIPIKESKCQSCMGTQSLDLGKANTYLKMFTGPYSSYSTPFESLTFEKLPIGFSVYPFLNRNPTLPAIVLNSKHAIPHAALISSHSTFTLGKRPGFFLVCGEQSRKSAREGSGEMCG